MTRTNKGRKQRGRRAPRQKITAPAQHLTARPMTENLFVKLKWADDSTITALSSWRFGLAQFWAQKPGYYDQYMTIYKMSRIVSLTVKCTVINTTANTPAEVVLVVLPYSDYSKTLAQAKQLPKATFKYLSGSGGIDKVSVSKTANLNQHLGVDSRSIRDYQQSASEAASTLALLPDTPILALYVGGASTEPTLRVFIEVTYNVEFFLPEYPGSLLLKEQDSGKLPICCTDNRPARVCRLDDNSSIPRSKPPSCMVDEDEAEVVWVKARPQRK